jgi:hypothetical protein
MTVVYQISRINAGIHPMVAIMEECPLVEHWQELAVLLRA